MHFFCVDKKHQAKLEGFWVYGCLHVSFEWSAENYNGVDIKGG